MGVLQIDFTFLEKQNDEILPFIAINLKRNKQRKQIVRNRFEQVLVR